MADLRPKGLPPRHLLRRVEQQIAVGFVHAAEQPAEGDSLRIVVCEPPGQVRLPFRSLNEQAC
jgi:hypothetical protein